jgi:hypothetical protein
VAWVVLVAWAAQAALGLHHPMQDGNAHPFRPLAPNATPALRSSRFPCETGLPTGTPDAPTYPHPGASTPQPGRSSCGTYSDS